MPMPKHPHLLAVSGFAFHNDIMAKWFHSCTGWVLSEFAVRREKEKAGNHRAALQQRAGSTQPDA